MKKIWMLSMLFFTLLILAACSDKTNSNGSSDKKTTIRIGNFNAETTTYGQAFESMKAEIEEKSKGTIKVDIFHNGSLGSEQDHIQAIHDGSLEMMHSGTAGIGLYIPEVSVFELWYNFTSVEQLKTAFTKLTPDLEKVYEEKGFKLLGAYYDGPRNILSNKKVESIKDMSGLGFRVPDSTLYVDMAEALGSNAITMPYGDVYTSLQTGAIDAMEGTPDSVLKENFYEQAKYFILDEHVYQPLSIVYNLDSWNALPEDQQEIIANAVKNASDYHLKLAKESNDEALEEIKSNGVVLIEVKDIDKWREAVTEKNESFVKQHGETGDLIYNVVKETLKSN